MYEDGHQRCRVWRYCNIGPGKVSELPECPKAPRYILKSKFRENISSVGSGKRARPENKQDKFYCTDEHCLKSLDSIEQLQEHLDFGVHEYSKVNPTQLSKVMDMLVKMHQVENATQQNPTAVEGGLHDTDNITILPMGWAIKPERVVRRHSAKLKEFLDRLFDEGERTKNKCTPERALNLMRKVLDVEDIIPLQSIKSYFSRRSSLKRAGTGEPACIEIAGYEVEDEHEVDADVNMNTVEERRETAVQGILHDLKVFDIRVLIIILQLERKLQKADEVRQGYKQFWILLSLTVSSLGDFDSLPFVNFLPIHCILMYRYPTWRKTSVLLSIWADCGTQDSSSSMTRKRSPSNFTFSIQANRLQRSLYGLNWGCLENKIAVGSNKVWYSLTSDVNEMI